MFVIYIIKVWLLVGVIDVIILRYKFGTRITVYTAVVAIFLWPYIAYKHIKDALR